MTPGQHLAGLLEEVGAFFRPLPDKPEETADSVLRALWLTAAGRPTAASLAAGRALPDLDDAQSRMLRDLIGRKRAGAPLAHLTGRQEFMGLELLAGPGAMIPRRETEILGRAALAEIRRRADEAGSASVIDVCTGSGNLALAYAHHEPKARVLASDLSADAVEVARRNAEFTTLGSRVEFRVGDLLGPFEGTPPVDVLSCNPPYISTAKVAQLPAEIAAHEPRLPFDGGAFGLSIITRLLKDAERFVKPGGALCFEIGLGQGPGLQRMIQRLPWAASVAPHADAAGAIRAFVVTRSS